MPIYDIHCRACGRTGEVLVMDPSIPLVCPACGSAETEKQMAATSSLTGKNRRPLPGPGDTSCCGGNPSHAGCAGPGSCCGRPGGIP
jgi:putative FmdB family regulatory protein